MQYSTANYSPTTCTVNFNPSASNTNLKANDAEEQFAAAFYDLTDQLLNAPDQATSKKIYADIVAHFATNNYHPEAIELLKDLLNLQLQNNAPQLATQAIETISTGYIENTSTETTTSPLTGLDFTDLQVQQAIAMANTVRSKFAKQYGVPNMIKLTENTNLTSAQKTFVKTPDAVTWLYEDTASPPPAWENYSLNFEIMAQNPTFRNIAATYPNLLEDIDASNLITDHDTSALKPGNSPTQKLARAFNVLALRFVKQYNCFVLRKCASEFDGFAACFLPTPACQRGKGWTYTVMAAYPLSESMTFVFLPGQGRFASASNHKQNSAIGYAFMWSYGMSKLDQNNHSTWPPQTGSPFTVTHQQPCSQCPSSHPYPETSTGLCSSVPVTNDATANVKDADKQTPASAHISTSEQAQSYTAEKAKKSTLALMPTNRLRMF